MLVREPPAAAAAAPPPPPPPPPPVSSAAASALFARQQHWLREREERLAVERAQRDAKELVGCSFRPDVSRTVPLPTAANGAIPAYAAAPAAAAAAAPAASAPAAAPVTDLLGVEAHLARVERARRLAAERTRVRHVDGSGWTGRLTQPRGFVSSLAVRRGRARAASVDAGSRGGRCAAPFAQRA